MKRILASRFDLLDQKSPLLEIASSWRSMPHLRASSSSFSYHREKALGQDARGSLPLEVPCVSSSTCKYMHDHMKIKLQYDRLVGSSVLGRLEIQAHLLSHSPISSKCISTSSLPDSKAHVMHLDVHAPSASKEVLQKPDRARV